MDTADRTRTRRLLPAVRFGGVAFFALLLVSGPALAACADGHATAPDAMATAMPTMASEGAAAGAATGTAPQVVDAVWASRPAFVGTSEKTETAYAFALRHPEVVQWMPCYCGCEAMGHGSNLGCYFQHGRVGPDAAFEEHASYCEICVDITIKTKELYEQGVSLRQIRQIVDQQFGGSGVPGTQTALPPA